MVLTKMALYKSKHSSSRTLKKDMFTFGLVTLVLLHLLGGVVTGITPPTYIAWEEKEFTLNHMVVDQSTGDIYLGGKDRIWKLDSNLNVKDLVVTGPVEDDPEHCVAPFQNPTNECQQRKRGTAVHNYNQILVFDPDYKILVTCGTAFHGTCQVRDTDRGSLNASVTVYDSSRSYYLAANKPENSTVAFIAPGPPNPEVTNVLYVGVSYSGYFDQRNIVPAVSSRQLSPGPERLEYAAFNEGNEYGTYIDPLDETTRQEYPIQYITGFNDTGYSYFLTVQKDRDNDNKPIDSSYITKIVQICHADTTYSSYVEIELECRSSSNNAKYNLVQSAVIGTPGVDLAAKLGISSDKKILIAAFSKGENDKNNVPQENMALCIYRMTDIRRKFVDNIQACSNNNNKLAPHFTNEACIDMAGTDLETIGDDFCGIEDSNFLGFNHPVDGNMPASAQSIKESTGYRVTAIATEVINDDTVAFLGTSDGDLRKTLLYDDSATEYNSISLSDNDSPILQDMSFDASHEHLYAITEETVYRIRVSECDKFTTCDECKQSRDPYCGWCSLENRCSRKSECENGDDFQRWLSYRSWECLRVNTYHDRVTLTKQTSISMTIQSLPPGNKDQYKCVFDDKEVAVDFITGSGGETITCTTPERSQLPQLQGKNDHINTTFAIKSVETGVKFVEKPITFFDCTVHRSCSNCSQSNWQCLWCLRDNVCNDYTTECSTTSSERISYRSNCPRLVHNTAQNEILIPIGHSLPILIETRNLPNILSGEKGYECLVHLHTPPTRVPAVRRNENLLECETFEYEYTSTDEAEKKANLDVVWNDNYLVDDDFATEVTAYKCNVMGPDCSICISVQNTAPKYGCNWCGTSCKFKDSCSSSSNECPKPTLTNIWPLNGPVEGGTRITIDGTNLGYARNQIESAVTVGQGVCSVKEYDISRRIICRTAGLESSVTGNSGNIVVAIGDTQLTWPETFVYKDPVIRSMEPRVGPVSGGTEISIQGSKLDTGANIEVWLGLKGSNPCDVIRERSTDDMLLCRTKRVSWPLETDRVTVEFDIQARRMLQLPFSFKNNPTIKSISPLTSFHSGGRKITVEGTGFDVITKPMMYYKNDMYRSNYSECTDVNPQGTQMVCPSPNVPIGGRLTLLIEPPGRKRRQAPNTNQYQIAFSMDDVESVRNLQVYFSNITSTFNVFPDPVFTPFENRKRVYKGEALILEGENLNFAADRGEFVVQIGNGLCLVESLNRDKLYCRPPEDQPLAVTTSGSLSADLPMVKVTVGNLLYELGTLEYQTASVYFPLPAIIGIIAGGSVLILTIIVILIVCRRRSTLASRQYKKMKAQLDALESNVRNECKQAFAELQTEVSDVTSDLSMTGIPIWDYRQYNFKVLFPSHQDHPVLHMTMDMNGSLTKMGGFEQGLQQFNQLLNSKQFLVIFIRTLESQKNFSIRDRAIVASLLMIVLMDKMEYATEILKSLLNELIDRSVEKKHPKLMLRRTESVVEKFLTNWLSICMYGHIKKHTGKSLYLLYKAIKQQTEKGPVDAITSEARYSLSEDRLLREKIEPTTLNINLVAEGETEVVICKMLDCDTITQAKEKALDAIYKNTPFSRRPAVHDVDLEWRSGRSGHLPLQDDDVTTEMIRGWKRINTLRHYHVPDGATMALSFKQAKNDYVRNVHGMVEITSGSSLGFKPIVTMEEGTKVWHLVKHDDGLYISRTQKVISEIFLTRLLTTKGTVQQYVDDLFLQILKVDHTLPPAIKYLYDFLDTAARRHNIVDSEVVHTWKSNSLPLRFWVNIIKNPEFVFDIQKSHITDSCLSTIAQTFMDACSTSDHKLGKDSPTNKLLFARDIPRYRKWVERYYKEVQEAPPVTDHDMNIAMTEISMTNIADFNVSVALKELYRYATQYNFELLESLDDDPSAKKLHLAHKFEQVAATIDGSPLY